MGKALLLILSLGLMLTGCGGAIQRASSLKMPGENLQEIEQIYIKRQGGDERNLHLLIKDELIKKGYRATTEDEPKPQNVDAVLVYFDRWAWDITMYMIQLTIYIKSPEENFVLGAGKSIRLTFVRKDPPDMIREVLDLILDDKL